MGGGQSQFVHWFESITLFWPSVLHKAFVDMTFKEGYLCRVLLILVPPTF